MGARAGKGAKLTTADGVMTASCRCASVPSIGVWVRVRVGVLLLRVMIKNRGFLRKLRVRVRVRVSYEGTLFTKFG